MKKIITYLFILFLSLILVTSAEAVTVKKVTKPVITKTKVVTKKVVKVTKAVVPKIPVTQGLIETIDYDEKILTLKVGEDIYTVNTTAKTKVYVPKITKVVKIDNLAPEMVIKVTGIIDKEQMQIVAQTINLLPIKVEVK